MAAAPTAAPGQSLFDTPAPAAPGTPADPFAAVPTAPAVTAAPTAPMQRSSVLLTKPIDVQLAYGRIKLPVGTSLKVISQEGNNLKVNYLNTIVLVPVSSTDLTPATMPPP